MKFSFSRLFILLAGAFLIFSSCSSKPVKSLALAVDKDDPLIAKGARPLTFLGSNFSPRLSPDQTRFLFVSEKRRSHNHAQIYEYDFLNFKEKRLTFQDSPNIQASYYSNDQFLYASATDEVKEDFLNTIHDSTTGSYEIYQSDLQGSEIVRWTNHPGPDTFPAVYKRGVAYLTGPSQKIQIAIKLQLQSPPAFPIKPMDGEIVFMTSQRNTVYWIQKKEKFHEIYFWKEGQKGPQLILKTEGEFQSLNEGPMPQSWLISYKPKSSPDKIIVLYQFPGKCVIPLLQQKGQSLEDPILLNTQPARFLLTRKWQGQSQIYMMDLPPLTIPCHSLDSEDTLNL